MHFACACVLVRVFRSFGSRARIKSLAVNSTCGKSCDVGRALQIFVETRLQGLQLGEVSLQQRSMYAEMVACSSLMRVDGKDSSPM